MTQFQLSITPIDERVAQIHVAVESHTRAERFFAFRSQTTDLPVVRLPIALPIYRLANYRTRVRLLNYERENSLDTGYCIDHQEEMSVQRFQHGLLWDFAKEQRESVDSILDVLKEQFQREPILITHSGVVVNGNRRLSAMRELYAVDPQTYSAFAYVDCMVLPADTLETEIRQIEVQLQMTPQTILPYGWVNECMAVRDLVEIGMSLEVVAGLMRIDKKRVELKLAMLDEADLFLNVKEAAGDYDSISDTEQLFKEMAPRLRKKEGADKEVSRKLGQILVERRGTEGRTYELMNVVGALTQDVLTRISEDYPDRLQPDQNEIEDDDLEDFETIFGGPTSSIAETQIEFLTDALAQPEVASDIVDICRRVIESQKNKNQSLSVLKLIRDANTKLLEVDMSIADPKTYVAISSQLDQIIDVAKRLSSQVPE